MTTAIVLPTAKDAEQQVVGSLVLDPNLIASVAKLKSDDFTDPCHRSAFATLRSMHQEKTPIDIVSVKQRLATADSFARLGVRPAAYIAEVGVAVTTTAHCSYYASLIVEASRKRRLHDIASLAAESALNCKTSSEVLADLWAGVDDLRREAIDTPRFTAINAKELDSGTFDLEWIIDWLLVLGQPCIVAGPKKALKTTLLCALLLSIAVGDSFLGKFKVRKARRVLLCSGESGMATLQETCRRIAAAMDWKLADVPNFAITADLPLLNSATDLSEFEAFLQRQDAEVVAIDPAYLCMGSDDNGNLFAQGKLLLNISQLCQRLGVTLILCHHTKRNTGRDTFDHPELEDIAWAGFQEFARQWLLVGRRERYEPGSGKHRLWLSVGGSAGHGGLWAVDVDEGDAQSAQGRRWITSISNATEAHEQAEKRKLDAKKRQQGEQLELDVQSIVSALSGLPGRTGTKSNIRDASGLNTSRFGPALAEALRSKHLVPSKVRKENGQEYDGFQLGKSDA